MLNSTTESGVSSRYIRPVRLRGYFSKGTIEAGCDEAGRGSLAGPVVAAAVILPSRFRHKWLNDSKLLTAHQREEVRIHIEAGALAFAVGQASHEEVDRLNILRASFTAMHRALDKLVITPEQIIVDGNRFPPFNDIPFQCIVDGDARYKSIAAASILAKTYRDEIMEHLGSQFPEYHWSDNKGYPTERHREALERFGPTPYHRMTFQLLKQGVLFDQ